MNENKDINYSFDHIPMDRKDKKPLMERKRRARMNESLNELKKLILFISPQLKSKLEKADILEITVYYFKQLVTLHVNSLSGINKFPSINDDTNKLLKNEQNNLNMNEMKNFQTPNISSFLSPPSSVSPDNEKVKNLIISSVDETPNCYGINRKRKRVIENNVSAKVSSSFSTKSKNILSNNSLNSTSFVTNYLITPSFTNQETPIKISKLNTINNVMEEENKNVVWRPW
ncbi:Myc-type, basic helix-loop-helix (bHLH) domain-containing protein [Strongyloides ratti]|uniref:Myc-type, basic helix-loop-helix (BHLH) domain-containing protein n=1 Tax=Strongyloides ratti TaxID=34506 RepID=A0A090KX15_STRRB|nr:Myc-type, basic helix-loop-helix (bHLH) domain-containing protein [Strongyloides ratti]CEF59757.1 Myc-type, basic helix-loop-helix (bHLH) domain-containing protein [Strongyloides ratti]